MLFDSAERPRHPRRDSLPQKEHVLLYTSDQLEPENFHSARICASCGDDQFTETKIQICFRTGG